MKVTYIVVSVHALNFKSNVLQHVNVKSISYACLVIEFINMTPKRTTVPIRRNIHSVFLFKF